MSKDHGRYYAVYNRAGVHIGLWSDGKAAAEVAAENPGNTIEEYIRADHVDALLKAEREKALREAAAVCAETPSVTGHLLGPCILAAIDPAPVSVREAARVLLGHTPKITAKPLAEMSEAMKIDAHPAILLRGFCAALRAIEDGKDDD